MLGYGCMFVLITGVYFYAPQRLKVKVTWVKQRSKCSYTCIELVRAITCTFIHGFQKLFSTVVALEEEKCHLKHFFQVG